MILFLGIRDFLKKSLALCSNWVNNIPGLDLLLLIFNCVFTSEFLSGVVNLLNLISPFLLVDEVGLAVCKPIPKVSFISLITPPSSYSRKFIFGSLGFALLVSNVALRALLSHGPKPLFVIPAIALFILADNLFLAESTILCTKLAINQLIYPTFIPFV